MFAIFFSHVFIEYSNANEALEVLKGTNGYKFDKNHTFTVNLLTDFEKYNEILDKWENPTPQPFKEQGCLQYYLLDPDACDDQFSIVYEQGDKVAVNLNTQPEPALLEERPVSNFNACLNISIILTILTLVEMDRDFSLVVTPWYHLPTYFPCKGYCPLGRREVSTNRTYSRSTSGQMFFNLLPLCRLEILVH